MVEHIGNKIPFEKKLNIVASNGYFKKKKESYEKSKVQLLLDLSQNHNDWGLDEIRERNIRISDEILMILNEWGLNQLEFLISEEEENIPTEEELRIIEDLKRKGFI